MRVNVRYFASLREALGASEVIDVPAGTTLAGVRDILIARDEAHARALARSVSVRAAVNQVMCGESASVPERAEVAFFPPVTGG